MTPQLNLVHRLQRKYKTLHLGGSLSLFVRGYKLAHECKDIDLCIDSKDRIDLRNAVEYHQSVDSGFGCDFHYWFDVSEARIELRIDQEQTFDLILFRNSNRIFKCTSLETVLKYKRIYADKGYQKHFEDLEFLSTQIDLEKLGVI